jgi:hypothetical protein
MQLSNDKLQMLYLAIHPTSAVTEKKITYYYCSEDLWQIRQVPNRCLLNKVYLIIYTGLLLKFALLLCKKVYAKYSLI